MTLLSPWGLWWLLSVPLLLTFYLFRPEPRRFLSSTFFLWRQAQPESQGGTHARRLRHNPLLWLQLLVLIILALYLSRPATSWSSKVPVTPKVVLVIDRSASMNAGRAFEQAIEKAEEAVDGLFGLANFGSAPEVMLVAVDHDPQILVAFTRDASKLKQALRNLRPSQVPDRLATLRPYLASLVNDQKATVWLMSDHLPPELEIPGLQFSSCGEPNSENVGLLAFAIETGDEKPLAYVRAQNFSPNAEQRLLRIEKLRSSAPRQVEAVVLERALLLPAGGGQTLRETFPAVHLSASESSLFRARLLPLPGQPAIGGEFTVDDDAFVVTAPFGKQRLRLSVTPELEGDFLMRAVVATQPVELVPWEQLAKQPDSTTLDLLICAPDSRLPAALQVRTKFEVSRHEPPPQTPVELLRAADQRLVQEAGAEWGQLRVQRDTAWKVGPEETVLLSTASGPALTLKGVASGQPTLCWRFPIAYSSLPLSPALPVVVGRFIDEYSRPATAALSGSLTTSERRTRPPGAAWRGELQVEPLMVASAPAPITVAASDGRLPRLDESGLYLVTNRANGHRETVAVNLFSATESALPHNSEDRSFVNPGQQEAPAAGEPSQRQYRESTTVLAAFAFLLLLLEAALLLRRGRP